MKINILLKTSGDKEALDSCLSHASTLTGSLFVRGFWDRFIFGCLGRLKTFTHLCTLKMEKAMATHSSTLAWKIPWTEEPGGLQSMGSRRLRHDWATSLSLFTFMLWRRKWHPTPVFLPGESQGWQSLTGCRLWGSHSVGHNWSDLAAAAAAAVLERHSVSYLTMWVLRETGWRTSERVTCVGLWEKDPTFYPITRLNPLYGKQKNLPHELEDPNAERMESLFSFQKLCRMSYDNMGPSLE